ncbi:MAG: 23S rRNA (pseudouridine(1915)-N(3))-methyltransferase RlmH [Magnetococcales bacterium]|nr:23S rRNA (pseudouridine(1915)-N(3))-methyltransferase RlmH [Magnetococcales bacterium]
MKLALLAVGRGMPPPIRELVGEYGERLNRYGGFSLLEVAEFRGERSTESDRARALAWEGERLRGRIPAGAMTVALEIGGTSLSSPGLADRLGAWRDDGVSEICFLIGGPDGLLPELVTSARFRLSLGPMTLPHMLARVVLTEQLYRAMTILHRVPYHR